MTDTCETLQEEKRSMSNRLKELENNNSKKSAKSGSAVETEIESLKSKLQAAESLCEELMDENSEMKRELRDMEEEMEEIQDNFR